VDYTSKIVLKFNQHYTKNILSDNCLMT